MKWFGGSREDEDMVERAVVAKSAVDSDAPFRLEFAPGVILMDAEIRDRQSLTVFVNALQAMGALLPEAPPSAIASSPEPRNVTPAVPAAAPPTPTEVAVPPKSVSFAPATADRPGPQPQSNAATPAVEPQPTLV